MATIRKVVLSSGQIYHVYNRGVEKRQIFTSKREYDRAVDMLWYYRYQKPPLRYSLFHLLSNKQQESYIQNLIQQKLRVTIFCYALMPNHFHLLLRQEQEKGITTFISAFCNSYAKYFNTKHRRVGPLFQGEFKAVRIEDDEQLLHVSRYIHLSPVTSYLIQAEELATYPWTSLPEYLNSHSSHICDFSFIAKQFSTKNDYLSFLNDQVDYARTLDALKHVVIDPEE